MIGLLTRTVPRYRLWQAFYLGVFWGLLLYVLTGDGGLLVIS